MLAEKVIILRNVFIIEIGDAKINENIEQERKIKNGRIQSVMRHSCCILHLHINAEYPKRLDEQIQRKHDGKVGDEFSLHVANLLKNSNWGKEKE